MAPKKKVQDDDDSTEKLLRIYRKKCEEHGVNPSKQFREKVEQAMEGDVPHLKKVSFMIILVNVLGLDWSSGHQGDVWDLPLAKWLQAFRNPDSL